MNKTHAIRKGIALIFFLFVFLIFLPLSVPPSAKSLTKIPAYSGSAYVEVNGNKPYFSKKEAAGWAEETYPALDSYGRCGTCTAKVSPSTMPEDQRGTIGMLRPSGWHTVKYPGVVEDLYLYNRCHLIGYQLTGENANERNLITGTRQLNHAMLEWENKVAAYVKNTGDTVYYRVTPKFQKTDLLARGVEIEAWSRTKNRVRFHVFVFNVQDGIDIDYSTGDSRLSAGSPALTLSDTELTMTKGTSRKITVSVTGSSVTWKSSDSTVVRVSGGKDSAQLNARKAGTAVITASAGGKTVSCTVTVVDPAGSGRGRNSGSGTAAGEGGSGSLGGTYVLNTNTMKFHYPTCSSVKRMSEKNKKYSSESRSQLIAEGYSPCGICHP